jgi:hypothetical protein
MKLHFIIRQSAAQDSNLLANKRFIYLFDRFGSSEHIGLGVLLQELIA